MATVALLRKTALALPGAVEIDWYGGPMFNVGKKTFIFLANREKRWVFKLAPARQEFLFEVQPEVFQPWRNGGMLWSYVDIAALSGAEAKSFVTEAWMTIVPRKISRPYLQTHAPQLLR